MELGDLTKDTRESTLKTFEERQDEKRLRNQDWRIINIISFWLMIYACLDFTIQIIAQMPVFKEMAMFEIIGFRKVWRESKTNPMSYEQLINNVSYFETDLNGKSDTVNENTKGFTGLEFDWKNFLL